MLLLLSVPVQRQNNSQQTLSTISIELKPIKAKTKGSKPEKIFLSEPVKTHKTVVQPKTIKPEPPIIKTITTKSPTPKPKKSITSNQIFYSASQVINEAEIPEEFQKAIKQPAYIERTPEMHNWRASIPYLDETTDQPRIEMDF
ncbi:MAG: hypothetical protein L3J52_00005, partial [Proteobacteria bacterium]|nr:hypothetical protein [Pseudomonadota bacterium]